MNKKNEPEYRSMRDSNLLAQRNKEIERYFNERYKSHSVGPINSRYNIAVAETAKNFFLSERTITRILGVRNLD